MPRVTLLVSGVPQYVTLRELSYNLDRLFNTDEIETFKVRDLPNHPQSNKRQVALDFRTSYDAMAAQEKLEGYAYVLDNGREYTLHAKINKSEEYMCSESSDGSSCWYGDDWTSLAHAKLDARLELLRKQKLVIEKEEDLLNARKKLKRKYGSMFNSLYEGHSIPRGQLDYYVEHTYDTEAELSPPKRSRSTSQDHFSSSMHPRSRKIRPRGSRRSHSKDSGYVLPQIEWHDELRKTRDHRSRSGERSRSRSGKPSLSHPGKRSRSRSRESSMSRSGKRLMSRSGKRSRSRSTESSTSRSGKRSRSRSGKRLSRSGKRSRSRSASRTRSRVGKRSRSLSGKRSRSRSRETSRSRNFKSPSRSGKRTRSRSGERPRSRSGKRLSRSGKRSRSRSASRTRSRVEKRSRSLSGKRSRSRSRESSRSRNFKSPSRSGKRTRSRSGKRPRPRSGKRPRCRSGKLSRSRSGSRPRSRVGKRSRSHSGRRSRSHSGKHSRSRHRESSRSETGKSPSRSGKRSRSRSGKRPRPRSGKRPRPRSGSRPRSRAGKRSRSHSGRRSRSHSGKHSRSRSGKHSRSRSRERSRSRAHSRDRRSRSRERDLYRVSRHREPRSKSKERPGISELYRRTPSKERVRARSKSQERTKRHSKEPWSHSRERMYFRGTPDRTLYRRSRSRDRTHPNDHRVSRTRWDHGDRRLRSPDRRTNQLVIMPRSPRGSPSKWSVGSSKAGSPKDTKHETDIKNKEVRAKVGKDPKNTVKQADMKEIKTDNKKKNKDEERKKIDNKFHSKSRKAEKTASRVQTYSKDVMVLIALLVDEIMDRDKIRISAANKLAFIKILEAIVQERLEPIARIKKIEDNEVLKKYKMQYPMEDDLKMIKQMLGEIPKLEMREPAATITVSSDNKVDVEVLDVNRKPTEQQCTTNTVSVDLTQVDITDSAPQIKTKPKNEPILVIDLDSAEKPVPRHPQFAVVIKNLVKNMNSVIRTNRLGDEIKFAELKHVLRHILRNMLKGKGFLPREEIIRKFREIYPMENDEQFVRNIIKDIRDGKYPGLASLVVVDSDKQDDSSDDVVIVEKKHDVVTITDSDDDDVEKKREVISLDSEPIHDNSGQAKPNSSRSQAMPGPSNGHAKLGAENSGQEGSSNSGPDQPKSNKTAEVNTDLVKPGQAMINTSQSKTVSDNLGQTNINTANVNMDRAKTGLVVESDNSNQANSYKIGVTPGLDMPVIGSLVQVKTLANPIQVPTSLVNLDQNNASLAKPGQEKTMSAGPSQGMPNLANSSQVTDIGKPSQAKTGVPSSSQAKTGANYSQAIPNPGIACQAKKSHKNPDQAKKGLNNLGQSNKGALLNAQQAKTVPTKSGQTKIVPANSVQAKSEKRASLDNTIQNLESKEIHQTPDRNKTDKCVEDPKKDNDNNLKVTSITIVTSLNELIAKTANESETISADEIKEEIDIKDELELDESSLSLDHGPRVTAITIMTSDAELFSLGNEERKDVNEIKNETDLYYDAEDNLVKDIERAFDDVNFGNIQSIEQNSVNNTEQSGVKNTGQLSSVKDDEETIESIVKYVASMY